MGSLWNLGTLGRLLQSNPCLTPQQTPTTNLQQEKKTCHEEEDGQGGEAIGGLEGTANLMCIGERERGLPSCRPHIILVRMLYIFALAETYNKDPQQC